MRKYTPRRAGHPWLQDARAYVLDCFDNRGKTGDRYTVIFGNPFTYHTLPDGKCAEGSDRTDNTYVQLLDMSESPTHSQGVSLWGEYRAYQIADYRMRNKHYRVRWLDLPENIRRHVIARAESD